MKKNVFLFESKRIDTSYHFAVTKPYTAEIDELTKGVHWHNYFEVEIVLDGRSEHILNNKSYEISRGSACLFTFFDFHTIHPIDGEYVTLLNFNFDFLALPENITNILLNLQSAIICKFNEDELQEIISDVDIINREQTHIDDPIHQTILTTVFTKIILTILRKCDLQQISGYSNEQVAFNKAVALMQGRFREDISLSQLANEVGFSPNYLGQLFKKKFGKTYNEHLKTIRLKYSKNLLKYSDSSIADISKYCGFKTTSYFIQCFKSEYHITPKQYCIAKRETSNN